MICCVTVASERCKVRISNHVIRTLNVLKGFKSGRPKLDHCYRGAVDWCTCVQNRLKTMMAILQQWLTLLLAHIDWVGQAGRIAAATSTLSQLTGPSPAVLEHLVNTRAALNVIQFNAEQTSTPNITTELQMGDLLETAVSVMHWTTMKISRGDTDDDTSALQAVNMMLQSKLSTGFGRIHQSLRDINHCFDRLTADLVWEEQVPETIDAIQAAADRTDRSLEHEDSNLWSNAPLGQDNLDSYLQQVGAPDTQFSQLQDATGQPSPFLQACTERGDNFRGILFWCFMLSLFVVFYFPAIRSFRWFVGFFLVFFCMALASAGAKTDEQSKREFFSSALLASWEGRVHDSGVAGAGWYRRLGAEM